MEEIIDNELWKIDDEDLWDAFAECKPSPYILDQNRQPVLVKQNEIEVIKYNVVSVPDPYTGYPGYLRLMWIRERKFGKFPLRKKDAPAFFKRVFALGGTEVGVQGIQYRLNGLEYDGYFKSGGSSYILTKTEEKKAQEWFDNLVIKAGHSKEVTVPSPPVPDSVPDDSPFPSMAATGKGNRQTYPLEIVGKTATIDPANDPADTRVTEYSEKALGQRASENEPIIAAINEVRDAIKENTATNKKRRQLSKSIDFQSLVEQVETLQPLPVYIVNQPKPLTHENLPTDKEGFWLSEKEYADRKKCSVKTLKTYRETKNDVVWSKCGTWGKDKTGNIFKKANNKQNSPYLYFVFYDAVSGK